MSVIAGGSVSILTRDGPFGIESVRGDGGLGHNDSGRFDEARSGAPNPGPGRSGPEGGYRIGTRPAPGIPQNGPGGPQPGGIGGNRPG